MVLKCQNRLVLCGALVVSLTGSHAMAAPVISSRAHLQERPMTLDDYRRKAKPRHMRQQAAQPQRTFDRAVDNSGLSDDTMQQQLLSIFNE